ncbi:MAG: AAA family ATPase, partial [Bacteroidia bacterium]
GYITDSLGRKIDFRNTIIIMTSNIGSRQLKDFGAGVGFGTAAKTMSNDTHTKSVVENALKRFFSPEFLNRIDDVIVFNPLEKESIEKILEIGIDKLVKRIEGVGFKVILKPAAKDFLVEKGYDREFGARPLARAIQKYLEDPIAEEILKAGIADGDTMEVDLDKKEGILKFKNSKPKKVKATE